jgi:hypothetical protein
MFRDLGPIRAKTAKGRLAQIDVAWRRGRLLDLANLKGPDCEPFWRATPDLPRESDSELLKVRNEVRAVLDRGSTDGNQFSATLNRWLRWRPQGSECASPFVVNAHIRSIRINPGNLRVFLAFAVNELLGKVGHCANPNCPAPYYIKRKKKYRFCDRPACQAFGQRQHKREWWRKHGKEWLASRKNKRLGKSQRIRRRKR